MWYQRGSDINGEDGASPFRGDWFGGAVAMSDDGYVVAAGAQFNDGAGGSDSRSGHVRVFECLQPSKADTGQVTCGGGWAQRGGDIDGQYYDFSGSSVAMSSTGDTVAVGSPRTTDHGETIHGRVRVYDYDTELSAWEQRGATISGEQVKDKFGATLAMSDDGNTVAVGAYLNDAVYDDDCAGHVRVFDWDGASYAQRGADINGESSSDYSGYSVAMDAAGNTVASGARYTADAGCTLRVELALFQSAPPRAAHTRIGRLTVRSRWQLHGRSRACFPLVELSIADGLPD